jgi:hypothetical protein
VYGTVQIGASMSCLNTDGYRGKENVMYIGGTLGTILVIALIVYLLRRA